MIDCAMARKGDEELRRLAGMRCHYCEPPHTCCPTDGPQYRCEPCRARRELEEREGES